MTRSAINLRRYKTTGSPLPLALEFDPNSSRSLARSLAAEETRRRDRAAGRFVLVWIKKKSHRSPVVGPKHGRETDDTATANRQRAREARRSFAGRHARATFFASRATAKSISTWRERFPGWLSGKYCFALGYRFTHSLADPARWHCFVSHVSRAAAAAVRGSQKKHLSPPPLFPRIGSSLTYKRR